VWWRAAAEAPKHYFHLETGERREAPPEL